MALQGAEWVSVIIVFILVLGIMMFYRMGGKLPTSGRSTPAPSSRATDLLSSFVVHEGNVIGEVVSRDGDDLIIKQRGVYQAIPVSATRNNGDEVHVVTDIDWDAAKAAGAAWLASNTKGAHNDISANLTTSADVRRPALGALQKQQSDDSEE